MQSIRSLVESLYSSCVRAKIDNKMLRYWTNVIQRQEKTLDDFRAIILASEDMLHAQTQAFRDQFYRMVGIHEYDPAFFDDYKASWASVKDADFSDRYIQTWIQSLPCYQAKTNDMIKAFFESARTPDEPDLTPHAVQQLMHIFACKGYDIEALDQAVQRRSWTQAATAAANDAPPLDEATFTLPGTGVKDPSSLLESQKAQWIQAMREAGCLRLDADPCALASKDALDWSRADTWAPWAPLPALTLDTETIARFEEILKRPMTIHEYFHYGHRFQDIASNQTEISALVEHQTDCYARLRDVYEKHVDQDLDEYSFIRGYLHKMDTQPHFMEAFIEDILSSEAYAKKMRAALSEKFQRMYHETLDPDDLDYVFQKVKAAKRHLQSEEISPTLVEFKKETDDIIAHIFDTFMTLLQRQPDAHESSKWVTHYRQHLDRGLHALDAELENDVLHSLEYHDIIKQKIKNRFTQTHGGDIMPSKMFELLSTCISHLNTCSSAKEIDFLILSLLKK